MKFSYLIAILSVFVLLSTFVSATSFDLSFASPTPANGSSLQFGHDLSVAYDSTNSSINEANLYIVDDQGNARLESMSLVNGEPTYIASLPFGHYNYYIEVILEDGSTNSTETRDVYIDTFDLRFDGSSSTIKDGDYVNNESFNQKGIHLTTTKVSDITLYVYNSSGDLVNTTAINGNSLDAGANELGLSSPGTYTYFVFATLLDYDEIITANRTFSVDTMIPELADVHSNLPISVVSGNSQAVSFSASANKFPLRVTFVGYSSAGSLAFLETFNISSNANFPLTFTIPANLVKDQYTINYSISDEAGNHQKFMLGSLNVIAPTPNPSGNPSNGGGGGTRGSSGIVIYKNLTNQSVVINTPVNSTNESVSNETTDEEGNETVSETPKSFFNRITGAVVGVFGNPSYAAAAAIVVVLVIIWVLFRLAAPSGEAVEEGANTKKTKSSNSKKKEESSSEEEI